MLRSTYFLLRYPIVRTFQEDQIRHIDNRWLGDITANQTRPKFSFTYEDVRPKHIEVDDDGVRAVNIGPWMSLLFLKNGNFYGIEIKSANAMDKKRLYHAN